MSDFLDPKEHLGDAGCPTPCVGPGGNFVAEAADIVTVKLSGGFSVGEVFITKDQLEALKLWVPIEKEPTNPLQAAMENRNLGRIIEMHGVRLMAFLAGRKLLEVGKDPVLSLAEMLGDYLDDEVIDLSGGEGGE